MKLFPRLAICALAFWTLGCQSRQHPDQTVTPPVPASSVPSSEVVIPRVRELLKQVANRELMHVGVLQHPASGVVAWGNEGGTCCAGYLARITSEGRVSSSRKFGDIQEVSIHRLSLESGDRFVIVLKHLAGVGTGFSQYMLRVIDGDDLDVILWEAFVDTYYGNGVDEDEATSSKVVVDFTSETPRIFWTRVSSSRSPIVLETDTGPLRFSAWLEPKLEFLESKWDLKEGRFTPPTISEGGVAIIERRLPPN